MQLFLSLDI